MKKKPYNLKEDLAQLERDLKAGLLCGCCGYEICIKKAAPLHHAAEVPGVITCVRCGIYEAEEDSFMCEACNACTAQQNEFSTIGDLKVDARKAKEHHGTDVRREA